MPRVKTGTTRRKRHKKILKMAKGYGRSKNKVYRLANQQVMKSLVYAYRDRRTKKRDFRKLWVTRISAACRQNGFSYNKFINGLKKAGVDINRKMLSDLAVNDSKAFSELVDIAKKNA
ncbi:50S ribosomal protein L20 [Natranaerofaba carboxydovora]|uniref:50S ribosomal protein L20 n=1 Tax=Natranaerofaba carboxydovora TaxID=2742683 RepID=UPI001F135171|nr:50S ribosomal protein L20 [Natranaerofaba carboxydovora]UMZ74049.1 50S ribosomal protein L20 [Natranaerofaba carboxydovora]